MAWLTIDFVSRVAPVAAKAKVYIYLLLIKVMKLRIRWNCRHKENCQLKGVLPHENCQQSKVHVSSICPACLKLCQMTPFAWPIAWKTQIIHAAVQVAIECPIGHRKNHVIWTAIMAVEIRFPSPKILIVLMTHIIFLGKQHIIK